MGSMVEVVGDGCCSSCRWRYRFVLRVVGDGDCFE